MKSFLKNVAIGLMASFLTSGTCVFASAGSEDVCEVNYHGCKYLVDKEKDYIGRHKLLEILELDDHQALNLPSDVIIDGGTISYNNSRYDYFYTIGNFDSHSDYDPDMMKMIFNWRQEQSPEQIDIIAVNKVECTTYFVRHRN